MIRIRSSRVAVLAAAGVVALAGCGGGSGGGGSATTAASAPTATTATSPAPAPPATATTPAPTASAPATPTTTTPQEAPGEGNGSAGGGSGGGGTGGTEPARTELTFTGSSAGVTPRSAGVAPYISVKVSLVSKDGSAHTLTIGTHTAQVGGTRKSAFFTLPGLRPGKSYTGSADGKAIRILSTSEPGP
ncbi:MAG: hypothetical protein QOC77_2401 [Thermoleophilaceae bacterium]|nr:hypothetical protein [Thermoleophilaceae bacterium]MEA2470637.1 hypothetical protein [Thermoleophilaceae bacterium]